MIKLRHAIVCLTVNLLAAGSLSADTLALVNSSFESRVGYNGGTTNSIPGWSNGGSGTGFGGSYGQVVNDTANFTAGLSGNNAIYLGGGISQTVSGLTLVPGVTYTLSVDVGNPTGGSASQAGVSFGFRNAANSAYLGQYAGYVSATANAAVPDGTFQTFTTTYTATAADAGNPITIALTDYFTGDTNYRLDNISLTSTAVPEPATFVSGLLLVSVSAFALVRQRSRVRVA